LQDLVSLALLVFSTGINECQRDDDWMIRVSGMVGKDLKPQKRGPKVVQGDN